MEVREDYRYHRLFVKHWYDCFPGYIALYLDRIDLPVLQNRKKYGKERYTRLNLDAVRSVYEYMTDRYQETGSYEDALWESSVFAHEQIISRMQADPTLKGLARYEPENNPLSGFDVREGREAYLNSRGYEVYRSPQYYLYLWRNSLTDAATVRLH